LRYYAKAMAIPFGIQATGAMQDNKMHLRTFMTTAAYSPLDKHMDLLLDAICVVDKDGRFLHISAGCEQIFGYTQAEMIGRQMLDLVHPDDKHITLQTVDRIISGEAQPHFENRYLRKNGETVHIMWSARWSEADQCRVAVARDITQRKHAEAVQMALFAISEASHNTEDLSTLFEQIHRIIGGLLPAQNFSIALYDATSAEVSFPYHIDEYNSVPVNHILTANTPCAQVIRTGQTLLLDSESITPQISAYNKIPCSWLGIPLKSHSRTTGALVLQHLLHRKRNGGIAICFHANSGGHRTQANDRPLAIPRALRPVNQIAQSRIILRPHQFSQSKGAPLRWYILAALPGFK
jgi:PAS domain S-box-containing protein